MLNQPNLKSGRGHHSDCGIPMFQSNVLALFFVPQLKLTERL